MNVAGGCLVVAFAESPSHQAALQFQKEIFEKSIRREAKGIILDVSAVSLIDSLMCSSLVDISRGALILGKKTAVVGLKPAVVVSLIDLEIDLSFISAAANIEDAIALINPPATHADTFKAEEKASYEEDEPEEPSDEEACETEKVASE